MRGTSHDDQTKERPLLVGIMWTSINKYKQEFKTLIYIYILFFRDLSFNSLLNWDTVDIASKLPSLTELNVTSSPVSWPGRHIASLPNITLFKGVVSYSIPHFRNHCLYCSLIKNANSKTNIADVYEFKPLCSYHTVNLSRYNFSSVWSLNFSITCRLIQTSTSNICKHTRSINRTYPYLFFYRFDMCWREINRLSLFEIPIGLVAMVINFTVMVTVISSTRLQKNVALFLLQIWPWVTSYKVYF
jgi:hypothetical protein